jgi:hypothetical protein
MSSDKREEPVCQKTLAQLHKQRAQRIPREKPSELRPGNHTRGGPCYKAIRFFDMHHFAMVVVVIHICVY